MKYLIIIFVLAIAFFPHISNAQFNINGTVFDAEGEPLPLATVVILSESDNRLIAGEIADLNGDFGIDIDQPSKYVLRVTMVGFEAFVSEPFQLSESNPLKDFGTILMEAGNLELEGVQVTADRPFMIREIDRTVLNIENRVSTAGSNTLDVLEQAPGIIINRQNNTITMLGKDGVNVMINGKEQYMPADALLDFLAGLDASNIRSIELITTPPASFDAEGNAGFINIELKNNPVNGFNGTVVASGGYGKGETGNGSINLNYRSSNLNISGNYSYLRSGQEQFTTFFRQAGLEAGLSEVILTSERKPTQNNHNGRISLDYNLGENTVLGTFVSGYSNRWDMNATNDSRLRFSGRPDSLLTSQNSEDNDWDHLHANLNLSHNFGNNGSLNLDVDYLIYENHNPVSYNLTFFDDAKTILGQDRIFSQKNTPFEITAGRADYTRSLNEDVRLSTGFKFSRSRFENDVLVEENDVLQQEYTSQSDLEEQIIAAYSQLDYQLGEHTAIKAGLRIEHSDTELTSTNEGTVVDRSIGRIFPSLLFSHDINPKNSLNLSYAKRINRPAFSDMAPFVIFLDPSTSFRGNAALQPAVAHTFQAGYRFKEFNITGHYTLENSSIVRFQNRFNSTDNSQLIVPDNLRDQQIFSTSISYPLRVADWWNMRYSAMYTWRKSNVENDSQLLTIRNNNLSVNGSQSFTLARDLSAEISGFFQTRSQIGNVRFEPLGTLNVGIQKQFSNNSRLSFNVTDILNSLKRTGKTSLADEDFYVNRTFDFSQRTFKLTYSLSFGSQNISGARNRDSAREEKERIN
jgi:hypothetical protein